MGLFTEKCACGYRVKKGAANCSQCGEPRRSAWRLCFNCGSSVGAQSKYCWKCRADLTGQPLDALFDDRWTRSSSDFAVKFPLRVSSGIVKHGIQVDEGTRAFLYVNGKSDGFLEPGYHVKSSLFERLTKLESLSQNSYAILVSTGPTMVSFPITGLHDSQQVPLGALIKLELELNDPALFCECAMIGKETFGDVEMVQLLGEELKDAVQKKASKYTIEELLRDDAQREGVAEILFAEMPRILESYGLRMQSVRLARFSGEEVENIRKGLGEQAVKARQNQIRRELEKLDREDQFASLESNLQFDQAERRLRDTMELDERESEWLKREWEAEKAHLSRIREITQEGAEQVKQEEVQGKVEDAKWANEVKRLKREREILQEQIQREILAAQGQKEVDDVIREGDLSDLAVAEEAGMMGLRLRAERDRLRYEEELRKLEIELKRAEGLAKIEAENMTNASQAIAAQESPAMANALVRLLQVQKGETPSFEPGPHNREFKGLEPGTQPFANLHSGSTSSANAGPELGHFKLPASAAWDSDKRLAHVAENKESAIGLITLVNAMGKVRTVGTGWHMGQQMLGTCAHVAETIVQGVKSGEVCWVSFSQLGSSTLRTKVSRSVIHPSYAKAFYDADGKIAVPDYDVAILMLKEAPEAFLPVASEEKLKTLMTNSMGTKVAYLGFPTENLAAGGVHLARPVASFQSGTISRMTDWSLGGASFDESLLISHNLPLTGGASGSPLFDVDGDVVGVVCAGNMTASSHPETAAEIRTPSAAMVNFAQRVDLLGELLS